jgi:hypothetical protein
MAELLFYCAAKTVCPPRRRDKGKAQNKAFLACLGCSSVALFFVFFLPLGVFQTSLSQRTLRRGGAEKFR